MSLFSTTDRAAGGLARAGATPAGCALVWLGLHLAADRLDQDLAGAAQVLAAWLDARLPALPVAVRDLPLGAASAWAALGLELASLGLLCASFVLVPRAAKPSLRAWWRALSPRALVLPAALAGVLAAGCWSLAIAAEDLLPPSTLAPWASGLLGAAAGARYGLPAWCRAVAALDPPSRRLDGLASALLLAPLGLLAWIHGVPFWGWLR